MSDIIYTPEELQEIMKHEMEPNLPSGATFVFNAIRSPRSLTEIALEANDKVRDVATKLDKLRDYLSGGIWQLDEYFEEQEKLLQQLNLAQAELDLIKSLIIYKTETWKQSQAKPTQE